MEINTLQKGVTKVGRFQMMVEKEKRYVILILEQEKDSVVGDIVMDENTTKILIEGLMKSLHALKTETPST